MKGAVEDIQKQLTSIGTGSVVSVSGTLRLHQYQTQGGIGRDVFEVQAARVWVLFDARRERMCL